MRVQSAVITREKQKGKKAQKGGDQIFSKTRLMKVGVGGKPTFIHGEPPAVMYRGPELAQYGRTLTLAAQYYRGRSTTI